MAPPLLVGYGEGFRTPALCDGGARRGAGVRKPPKEETAGRKGAVLRGATYGDLRLADGSRLSRRQLVSRSLAVETDDGGRA